MPRRSRTRLAGWRMLTPAAALLAALLTGCGGSDDNGDGGPGTPSASGGPTAGTSAPVTPDTSPTGGVASPEVWSSEEQSLTRTVSPSPRLVEVRSAHNEEEGGMSFDRVVLEFAGGLPGYTARYVDQVYQPGSGSPLPLEGQAYFEIVVTPAQAHDDSGQPTLRAPVAVVGDGLTAIHDVVMAGDFEGYVHIGVGLDDVVGFRVMELTGPDRLVFDFAA
ncbi:MAG: hypothetical protein IRZ08_07840 [Frankia sp.]|nr:hypothetical protein [Frankia sp.]